MSRFGHAFTVSGEINRNHSDTSTVLSAATFPHIITGFHSNLLYFSYTGWNKQQDFEPSGLICIVCVCLNSDVELNMHV